MARQPDVQYIQMYNHGSTARKLALRPEVRKKKYQLPEQLPQKQQLRQAVLDPLSICAVAVACVMLVAMLIGMFRVAELSGRRQELEEYIGVLQEQRADLQKSYESAYDLDQVELRARQMGMISVEEAAHIQMGDAELETQQGPGFGQRLQALFDELFAKAPR